METNAAPEPAEFLANQAFLRRLARSLVRDEGTAEDLVQETWATWTERAPRGLRAPRAWLARVLVNRATNERRGADRRLRRETVAARPERTAPDDSVATLEVQAQVVAALRALDEPYRSTLVQRYYHDLTPQEITARSGTPLNTVKTRLARGLERLRSELDRMHGGERSSWSHWLILLGGQPTAPLAPAAASAAARLAQRVWPFGGSSASVLGGWMLLVGTLAAGLTWLVWRSTRPVSPAEPVPADVASLERPFELAALPRAPVAVASDVEEEPEPLRVELEEEPEPPVELPPLPFVWPQLGGVPSHEPSELLAGRVERIAHPRVLWTHEGLAGAPTIDGLQLYSGGAGLVRLDLDTGKLVSGSREVLERIGSSHGKNVEEDRVDWEMRVASQGLTLRALVAGAPAIAGELVLARMVGDGSVSAFDRDLQLEVWRWLPTHPETTPLSGCLADDLFLVASGTEVVAVRVLNGTTEWRFDTKSAGRVDMVPAVGEDLLFFATDRGVVFALDVDRGREVWRQQTDRSYGWAHPVVAGDHLLLVDWGRDGEAGELRAFQTYDGLELWKGRLGRGPCSTPAVGADFVAVGSMEGLHLFAIEAGEPKGSLGIGREQVPIAPVIVGEELVFGGHDELQVLRTGQRTDLRWRFRASQVLDLVSSGDRMYAVLPEGLVCIADDRAAAPVPPDFVLRWDEEEALRQRIDRARGFGPPRRR